jgi:hypothetical protein
MQGPFGNWGIRFYVTRSIAEKIILGAVALIISCLTIKGFGLDDQVIDGGIFQPMIRREAGAINAAVFILFFALILTIYGILDEKKMNWFTSPIENSDPDFDYKKIRIAAKKRTKKRR